MSSIGHLTIVEKLLGLSVDNRGVTAFIAVIQVGAILGSIVYFRADIIRLAAAWFRGPANREARVDRDYTMAWSVIVGSIPIGVVGLLAPDLITGPRRSLWFVVAGLVVWSFVMILAGRVGRQDRGEESLTLKDSLVVGVVQCLSLAPGVSRSGARISAGAVSAESHACRPPASPSSFAIPAPTAASVFKAVGSADDIASFVGWGPTIVATVVSLIVALAAIAWLLRIVAKFPITVFVAYRLILAVVVAFLLLTGVVDAPLTGRGAISQACGASVRPRSTKACSATMGPTSLEKEHL